MELSEIQTRLQALDSNKLIDIVRNYRQYGYSDDVRSFALSLLEAQGITREDLHLTGNLENRRFDRVSEILDVYKRQSNIAFVFYGLFLVFWFVSTYLTSVSNVVNLGGWICLIAYFIYLFKSFQSQSEFYKLTGEEYGSEGALVYVFLGMPFYIFMYFVFHNQMKERLKMVV